MSQTYPDYKTYRALYARYVNGRDVGELAELLEPLQNTKVLDLCGGEGLLSLAAYERGAKEVHWVDQEPTMISPEFAKSRVLKRIAGVASTLELFCKRGVVYDRAVCRQAVNYWLDAGSANLLARVLVRGGIFAFNTFNQKPSKEPHIKTYQQDGHMFVEVSWLVGETVRHVQVRDGMEPHSTSFRWISPERFRELLEPYFQVHEDRRDKTSLYKCAKR